MDSGGMRSSQATVLEASSTLNFFYLLIKLWELDASTEEYWNGSLFDITTKIPLEIPNVAPLATLEVCLSETLTLLRISYGYERGVTGGPLGFSLVLGLLEATLYQWSFQIYYYNHNNFQALSIIKAWIYVVSQGSWASISSPRQRHQFVITPANSSRL